MRAISRLVVLALCAPPAAGACTLDARGRAGADAPGAGAAGSGGGAGGAAGGTGAAAGGGGAPAASVCGDGDVEGREGCDDGNTTPGDGCGASCLVEDPNQCGGAPVAIAVGTTLEINGDTTGSSDKVTTSASVAYCAAGTRLGGDHIYAVQPEGAGTLTATLVTAFPDHYLHTRTACPGTNADEVSCDYDYPASIPDVNTMPVEAGATYHVIVDSHENTVGTFTLTLALAP